MATVPQLPDLELHHYLSSPHVLSYINMWLRPANKIFALRTPVVCR